MFDKLTKLLGKKSAAEPEAQDDPVIVRTMHYTARKLVFRNLFASAVVEVGGESVEIVARGKTSRLNELNSGGYDDVITLTGKKYDNLIIVRGSTVSQTGISSPGRRSRWLRQFVGMMVLTQEDAIDLRIRVPEGTELEFSDLDGNLEIGDTLARVTLSVGYNDTATVGRVLDADIKADSSSRVSVQRVQGKVRIEAGFQSKVDIQDGQISDLELETDSSSTVTIITQIHNASVKAGFQSKVRLGILRGELKFSGDSSSELAVDGGAVSALIAKIAFQGAVAIGATVRTATLDLDSHAQVTIANVADSLAAKLGYNSRLNINGGDEEGTIAYAQIETDSQAQAKIHAAIHRGEIVAGYNAVVLANKYGEQVTMSPDSGRIATFK